MRGDGDGEGASLFDVAWVSSLHMYQSWQVLSRRGGTGIERHPGIENSAGMRTGWLIGARRRRNKRDVGTIAQQVSQLEGKSPEGGGGIKDAWASQFHGNHGLQVRRPEEQRVNQTEGLQVS